MPTLARAARRAPTLLMLMIGLSGCSLLQEPVGDGSPGARGAPPSVAETVRERTSGARGSVDTGDGTAEGQEATDEEQREPTIYRGTGEFIDRSIARQPSGEPVSRSPDGSVMLNFEGAPLAEVVRYILGEVLQLNYTIDPGVKGQVTMATTSPLTEEDLLPALERILRLNGAALVRDGDLYRVAAAESALRGGLAPSLDGEGAGLSVRIVPLEYIGATEMEKILQPFSTPGSIVRVDPRRNLLILAGTDRELETWLRTVRIFDVDWLEGMSVGLFPLENTEAEPLVEDLRAVTGGQQESEGPMTGIFRLLPIERLNSIMVVTRQPEYLDKARTWIERLDVAGAGSGDGRELHVYRMQHGKAADIAGVLQQVFGGKGSGTTGAADTGPSLARGMDSGSIVSDDGLGDSGSRDSGSIGNDSDSGDQSGGTTATTISGAEDENSSLEGEVRIIADETNNALLVMANAADYRTIETAIRKLDIAPLQVLVDATIVEVTLSGELRYGLQWFFKNSVGEYSGQGTFSTGDSGNLSSTFPGFNYSIVDSASQVRAVLSALASDSRVNVVSAPSVMVLDNQEARIRVGDRVPVRTSERSSNLSDDLVTVSNIQYQDTGVILEVVPRVNASGMVSLEIRQEVNDVAETQSSGIDSPTIQQRLIESTVAVKSGETIVLGGLIRDNTSESNSGVPGLRRLPLVGNLFSETVADSRRTELIVLLTPTVAHNAEDARAITEEFQRKLDSLTGMRQEALGAPEAGPRADGNQADTADEPESEPAAGDESEPRSEPAATSAPAEEARPE